MSRLRFQVSVSLDGFVAGRDQGVDQPLGVGGERLHEWLFPLASWRRLVGLEGGEVDASDAVVAESMVNIGATVMGRNMFGGHPGGWDPAKPWTGWWGPDPPFRHPVFVVTHHARAPLTLGTTTFHFVTDGVESALAQAKHAAKGKDVALGGGASVANQALERGLVDEMELHLVPILLGRGERLFDRVGDDLHGLRLARTVAAPRVTHLKFTR
ncbi:MAG TPA: dihydrofolate reductase family protein [Candidatus Limnocylindria bacterium]|nr:dihydrofolate reductase family protein [Candidatus Limnocylindria bacterium]